MRDIAAAVLAAGAGLAYSVERHALMVSNAVERGTLSVARVVPPLERAGENPAVWALGAGAAVLFVWARVAAWRGTAA